MSEGAPPPQRLQDVFEALVQKSIADSLGRVEAAVAAWRRNERSALAAHAEVLRHVARIKALSKRIARAAIDGPDTLIRDAVDAGVIDRAEARSLLGREPDDVAPSPALDEDAMRAAPQIPDKRSTMEKLLRDGTVLVHLDPGHAGVDVPLQHRGDLPLLLHFGYGLTPPITDLTLEDHALSGTLSFRGVPYRCHIPWTAVFAIVEANEKRGLVWSEDVPPALLKLYTPRLVKPDRPAPRLRQDAAGESSRADESEPPPEPPDKPRRGHLKLV